MRWDKRESGNFSDRRGMSGSGKVLFGGGAIGNYYSIIKSVWWRNWANHWQLFGVNTRKPDSK